MKWMHTFCVVLSFVFISANSFSNDIEYDFIVSAVGDGDFLTVQEAIDAVPDFRKNETLIFIKNGTYKEKLVLPASKNKVVFIGESVNETIITNDDYASKKNRFGEDMGTTGSSGFFIFGDHFTAKNITFENSAGEIAQAVAVRIDGDCVFFENCRFLGNQDTLYPHGDKSRQYYKNCYIEGTVDFIFGWSTALFDNCEIYCKRNGYITAASTNADTKFGFVFMNCKIYGSAEAGSVFLGRPWRPFAKTVFLECEMSNVIRPEGWHNWRKAENEKTVFYAEYKNTGSGANIDNRVTWSHQLSDLQGAEYTIENILDGWNPVK